MFNKHFHKAHKLSVLGYTRKKAFFSPNPKSLKVSLKISPRSHVKNQFAFNYFRCHITYPNYNV